MKNTNYTLAELMPHSEHDKQVLNLRAKHLAKSVNEEVESIQNTYYIRFKLGNTEFYGVPYQYIKEVILYTPPTKVPNTPRWVAGIINRQGILMSVLDLKHFFHILSDDKPKQAYLIILQCKDTTCALLADAIEGGCYYEHSSLDGPLATDSAISPKYILGLHQGITAILNIETLLSDLQLNRESVKENK